MNFINKAYEKGQRSAFEKISILGLRVYTLGETDDRKHSVGLNFPGLIDYSYDHTPGTGLRPTVGVSLIGPKIGVRFDEDQIHKALKTKKKEA